GLGTECRHTTTCEGKLRRPNHIYRERPLEAGAHERPPAHGDFFVVAGSGLGNGGLDLQRGGGCRDTLGAPANTLAPVAETAAITLAPFDRGLVAALRRHGGPGKDCADHEHHG